MQILSRNIRVNKVELTTDTDIQHSHLQSTENKSLLLFSCSVMSKSLQLHGLQHIRLPCPSLSPGVCQTHVHWVDDTIQPGHSLSPPSPPALSLPQHQGLLQWISSSHKVTKVLELQLQHQSPSEYSGLISLRLDCLISLLSTGLLRVFSSTTIQKYQFFSTQPSLWSSSHIHTRLLENP